MIEAKKNTPHDWGVNKKKRGWHVDFTPPPIVDAAGRRYPWLLGG